GLKVVVDCANGAAYQVAPSALWELGATVIAIGVEPNGLNINDGCGSTDPNLLKETVVASGADIGLALDGDADRLMVVDEAGTTGDGLVAGLQILAELVATERPASELLNLFEPLPQLLKSVRFNGAAPLETKKVKAAIAAGEAALGGKGRLVIRKSGTEPVIRVMAEGEDEGLIARIVNELCEEGRVG